MLKAHQGGNSLVQITIARGKLVTECVQNPKIDLIGAMRIGRVPFRLNVGSIIEQQVEHVMALMLMGSNNLGVDRHVVGDQGISAHAFLQSKIFR